MSWDWCSIKLFSTFRAKRSLGCIAVYITGASGGPPPSTPLPQDMWTSQSGLLYLFPHSCEPSTKSTSSSKQSNHLEANESCGFLWLWQKFCVWALWIVTCIPGDTHRDAKCFLSIHAMCGPLGDQPRTSGKHFLALSRYFVHFNHPPFFDSHKYMATSLFLFFQIQLPSSNTIALML